METGYEEIVTTEDDLDRAYSKTVEFTLATHRLFNGDVPYKVGLKPVTGKNGRTYAIYLEKVK